MAKRRKKRNASRGSVNNIILKSLIEGDKYGYEIIKDVESYSEGKIILKQPSLYSSLSRFEEKGYVSSYWGDSDIGGRRHYYHLTDLGIAYYQKAVLKITDEEDVEEDESETFDNTDNIQTKNIEIVETIEEKEVLDSETPEIITINEVDEDSIPAIVNFPDAEDKEEDQVFDHHFYNNTPIEKSIFDNAPVVKATPQIEPWKELANSVIINNRKVLNSPNKKFHYIIPKKQKKVILDKDGLYKLRDADYVPNEHKEAKPKIIDNVIKRTHDSTIYGYSVYTDKTNETKTSNITELSEEEKRRRNEVFVSKFNILTQSKYEEKENNKDYQEKLNIFMNLNQPEEKDEFVELNSTLYDDSAIYKNDFQNNLYNYVEDTPHEQNAFEEVEDKFVDFDPEEFEVKNDNKQYIEEISNYTPPKEDLKISRYEVKTNAILQDKSYVLINKVNCIFGIIMALLLSVELTISLFIFKNFGLIAEGDNILYITAYSLVGFIALCCILPVLFNPKQHKLNTFKLKYSMIFGILTFLVLVVLIYCVNTLIGFQLDNFNYFAVKLIVPTILAFNFVILPPIYSSLIRNRKFYD